MSIVESSVENDSLVPPPRPKFTHRINKGGTDTHTPIDVKVIKSDVIIDDNIFKMPFTFVYQRTLTYFIRGVLAVWMTYCLTNLDLAEQVNLLFIKLKQSS